MFFYQIVYKINNETINKLFIIILGIDPGLADMGYAFIEKNKSVLKSLKYGVIKTSSKLSLLERLLLIEKELKNLIKTFKPSEVACESIFFFKNAKTAFLIGQIKGIILLISAKQGLTINEYTPLQIKQSVACYGRAEKQQVQKMVQKLLNLKELPKPDHASDAIACAICHAYSRKSLLN